MRLCIAARAAIAGGWLCALALCLVLSGPATLVGPALAAPSPPPTPTPCSPQTGSELCVTGPGGIFSTNVVANGNVVNLYMSTTWDAVVPPASSLSKEALDSWTGAFIASDYLSFGRQYGIGTPRFGGGFLSAARCVPAASGSSPVLSTAAASGVISCNFGSGGALHGLHNTVANLIVPPNFTTSDGVVGSAAPCTTTPGYHYATLDTNLIPFTVIPTNPACTGSFTAVTGTMSHEIIEVLTDPIGTYGWTQKFGFFNPAQDTSSGEVADICSSEGDKKLLAPDGDIMPFFGPTATTFAAVQSYWSNSAQTCLPGVPPDPSTGATPLAFSEDSAHFTVTVNGTGFGAVPGNVFAIPGTGSMPYFLLSDGNSTAPFNAGNSLDAGGDATPLAFSTWSNSTVVAQLAISKVAACDPITATIWNPASAGFVTASATAPGPTFFIFSGLPSTFSYGAQLTGSVMPVDANQHVVFAATPMSVTVDGTTTNFTATGPFDLASLDLTMSPPPSLAGETITASATGCNGAQVSTATSITELPSITSVTPDHGLPNVSTPVTILGYGLTGLTHIFFGVTPTSNVQAQNGQLTLAAPPLGPGPVNVIAQFGSVTPYANESGYPFTYYAPDTPVLSQQPTCRGNYVTIVDYGNNGLPLAHQPIQLTFTNSALIGTAPATTDENGTAEIEVTNTRSGASVTVTIDGVSTTIALGGISACLPWQEAVGAISETSLSVTPLWQQIQGCAACIFTDVPVSQQVSDQTVAIYDVVAANLMAGIGSTFQPDAPATYAEIVRTATILAGPRARTEAVRAFGVSTLNSSTALQGSVSGLAATDYLSRTFQLGKHLPVPATMTFTRGELAQALWSYAVTQVPPKTR
jgi:hypothetical protein